MAEPLERQHAILELDLGVDLSRLLIPVGDGFRFAARVPLHVERHRRRCAVRTAQRVSGVLQQHSVRLVAQAPLTERLVARMTGPHLRWLDLQTVSQASPVELLDVEVGPAGTNEPCPVVELTATQLQADEQAHRGVRGPAPPPPRLDGDIVVTEFVGIREHARQTMRVIRYLSLEWLDALTAEVAASTELQNLADEHAIGVTQVITDGPEGTVVYHLQVGRGGARFGAGAALPEDVRMEQTWETATGVATGALNAQEAFIKGRILLSGSQQKLVEAQPVFAALDTVFRHVREHTRYA